MLHYLRLHYRILFFIVYYFITQITNLYSYDPDSAIPIARARLLDLGIWSVEWSYKAGAGMCRGMSSQ